MVGIIKRAIPVNYGRTSTEITKLHTTPTTVLILCTINRPFASSEISKSLFNSTRWTRNFFPFGLLHGIFLALLETFSRNMPASFTVMACDIWNLPLFELWYPFTFVTWNPRVDSFPSRAIKRGTHRLESSWPHTMDKSIDNPWLINKPMHPLTRWIYKS